MDVIETRKASNGPAAPARPRSATGQSEAPMIDIAKLKELVRLMAENDLAEVDLKNGEESITIKRGGVPVVQYAPAPAPVAAAAPAAPAAPPTPAPLTNTIDSPMVGTCYLAPNPDTPAFVKPGQRVTADTVVCLIEAMKVFNEIKAEKAGIVEQVLAKNGEAVEFGQKLFSLRDG
jgi:acetyl-CoA carboxylase biotin carboxyl carrier protein